MLQRLINRTNSPARTRDSRCCVEPLEGRTLLHNPFVVGVSADNRGEVYITMDPDSAELSPTFFNKDSVLVYAPGPDKHVGTPDDVRVSATIKYTQETQKLYINAKIPADAGYRVKLVASRISPEPGFKLDGEFNGTFPSGDDVAGGNFEFQTKNDTSSTPRVRMLTNQGSILMRLRKDRAPNTVNNFLNYSNAGAYDNMFFTRSDTTFDGQGNPVPFVIQGGSLRIKTPGTSAGDVIAATSFAPIADENGVGTNPLSNILGTLSFAKSGPNTATNQFFINLGNNSFLDSPTRSDGGFSVFAEITSGLSAAQTINNKPTANLTPQIGTVANSTNTGVTKVPVNNTAQAQGAFNPNRDAMIVRRTARLMKVAKLVVAK
ncbi:MAG: peptidylprolyl isomerase [Tepidisphaeraceae bacterium]